MPVCGKMEEVTTRHSGELLLSDVHIDSSPVRIQVSLCGVPYISLFFKEEDEKKN